MWQQTVFEEIKNLVSHPVIDAVFAEGEEIILKIYKNYERGLLTDEEVWNNVGLYYPSVRQLCPFMGLSLALTTFRWGSCFYESQYVRLMDDYELYCAGKIPNSKAGMPWLVKDLRDVQPFCEVNEFDQWKNANQVVEDAKVYYYHSWLTTRIFPEKISTESEADVEQKVKFFQLCDILGYAPDKLWFEFIPSGLDYPQISDVAHMYHDGGFVRLLFPFQCENGEFGTPIEGKTYQFVAEDGIRAEMQFEVQTGYETRYRGFIEHYTGESRDTLILIERIKDTNWYNLSYFFDFNKGHGDVFGQDSKWADFRAWRKRGELDYKVYFSQRNKVLYRILKEICGQENADWIAQRIFYSD